MKTLKKTLCLVLALALVLGTMGVASAAYKDFTDTEKINAKYDEAVQVMTALGIIDGMTDTTFVPQGNLTRAQAAKIVCYVLFGNDAAKIAQTATKWEDVPTSFWGSGYIAVLTEAGIINGVSDTKYDPDGILTGYQFAKLLICAMGYGSGSSVASDEVFEGSMWEKNVATYADKAGLLDVMDDGFALANNMTREEAVQMAFYAMLNPVKNADIEEYVPVEGTDKNSDVERGTYKLVSDGNGGFVLKVVYFPYNTLAGANYELGLVEGTIQYNAKTGTYFIQGSESYNGHHWSNGDPITVPSNAKELGRHAYAWGTWNEKTDSYDLLVPYTLIDSYKQLTADELASFEAAVKAAKTSEESAVAAKYFDNYQSVQLYWNGESLGSINVLNKIATYTSIPANETVYLYDYDGDGLYDAIWTYDWFVAQVSKGDKVTDTKSDDYGLYSYNFALVNSNVGNINGVMAADGAYTDGAYYIVVPNYGEYTTNRAAYSYYAYSSDFLYAPELVSTKTVTVSKIEKDAKGVATYTTSGGTFVDSQFGTLNLSSYTNYAGATYTFDMNEYIGHSFKLYLDKNGNVFAYEIAEQAEYVAYISDFYYVAGQTTATGHNGTSTGYTVYAHGVDLDGNVVSIPVANVAGDAAAAQAAVDALKNDAKTVKYFHLLNTGLYEITEYGLAESVEITNTAKYTSSSDDYMFTSATKGLNVTEANTVISTKDIGVQTTAGKTETGKAWIVWAPNADPDDTDYTVTNIFYDGYNAPDTQSLYIAAGTTATTETETAAGTTYTFNAYINGVKTSITSATDPTTLDSGWYMYHTSGALTVIGSTTVVGGNLPNHVDNIYSTTKVMRMNGKTADISYASAVIVDLTGKGATAPAQGDLLDILCNAAGVPVQIFITDHNVTD